DRNHPHHFFVFAAAALSGTSSTVIKAVVILGFLNAAQGLGRIVEWPQYFEGLAGKHGLKKSFAKQRLWFLATFELGLMLPQLLISFGKSLLSRDLSSTIIEVSFV